jgi:hypothetical protein
MRRQRASWIGIAVLLAAGSVLAQTIPNWSAPATWTPPKSGMTASTMAVTDLSGTLPFIAVTPCRVADTRGNGFTGAYGPPALGGGATRTFVIGGQCGIPTSAAAVSFNFTILSITTAGDIRVYPDGATMPLVSTQNWIATTGVIANAAITPLGTTHGITVHVDGLGTINLIIDVNGYYSNTPASGSGHYIYANDPNYGLYVSNASTGSGYGMMISNNGQWDGLHIYSYNTTAGSYGLHVVTGNTAGVNSGEFENGSGLRSIVTLAAANAISGFSTASTDVGYGVYGESDSGTAGAAGVYGNNPSNAGKTYGVVGIAGPVTWSTPNSFEAGGWFAGGGTNSHGIVADGLTTGVMAHRVNSSGATQTVGSVAYLGTTGLYTPNDLVVGGTKSFAEPHPDDPAKVIKYVALEGPEAGTYFRGRGRFEGRTAAIAVPEAFRLVTDADGLSIQVTPIGDLATVAVVSIGLDEIVLKSSRDVEFFYTVNGVRKAFKDFQPVQDATMEANAFFIPDSPSQTLMESLPAEIKRTLVRNGTYNDNGTVNMDTAERLGWAQEWRDREAKMRLAAEAAAAKRAAEAAAVASLSHEPH